MCLGKIKQAGVLVLVYGHTHVCVCKCVVCAWVHGWVHAGVCSSWEPMQHCVSLYSCGVCVHSIVHADVGRAHTGVCGEHGVQGEQCTCVLTWAYVWLDMCVSCVVSVGCGDRGDLPL